MKSDELKDYDIMDIEAMDDERLEKSESGKIQVTRVYIKSDVDAVIAELKCENESLKEMMPKYDQFIKDEKFKKKLVDEYDGYVYEWMGHRYIATPYINVFIKGILRALWLARARSAQNAAMMWEILSDEFLNESQFTIDFRCVGDPDVTEFQIFRGCMDWMKIYENVERKCRAKAEEYK